MTDSIKVTIPAETEIAQCKQFDSTGTSSPCSNGNKLQYDNSGELQYHPSTGKAIFKMPDHASCIDPRQGTCELEFILVAKSLNLLKAKDQDIADLISPPAKPNILPKQVESRLPEEEAPIPQQGDGELNFILFGVGALGIVLLIALVFKIWPRNPNPNLPLRKQRSSSSASQPPYEQRISIPIGSASGEDLRNMVIKLTQQLQRVNTKLGSLEDEIIGFGQRLQTLEGKSSQQNIEQIFPSRNSINTSIMPPPPPLPLSVELIKKAVSSGDYSLISAHPHYFLSETPQSQQGLEDVKRFIIDGDQSQSSNRTQSEFIAVACHSETYLIPNIVPNAADPSRTLKRHADKNNIYRNGQGTVFLNLEQLAVVQRNGDRFDLVSHGQIA